MTDTSPRWERYIPLAIFLLAWAALRGASIYGWVGFTLLGGKLVLSLLNKPAVGAEGAEPSDDHEFVTVAIPVYNEDPELFGNCLRSIIEQTRPPDKIHVVDDGSSDASAVAVARTVLAEATARGIDTDLTVFASNRGKREAQAVAFRASPEATVFLTVDSDTVLDPDALEEGLKPFTDERVMCVTGMVLAVNSRRNLLTRMIHLRYINAFMWERAAYSQLGSVLCACGSLALYRASVIHEHLDDFLGQRFLGKPAVFGDDRRLTNYALLHGRAVLQATAVARTAVPERLRHFLRQQLRWNKSFIRESVWVVQHMPVRSTAFCLTFLELASWIVFTLMLTLTMAIAGLHTGLSALGAYVAMVCLISFVRSGHYFSAWRMDGGSVASRLLTFLVAPIYGALHLLVLLPLRTVAALTLFSTGWGTRDSVEVRMQGSTFAAPADLTQPATGGMSEVGHVPFAQAYKAGLARVADAVAAWRAGSYERARGILEAEIGGPCDSVARERLDDLRAEVDILAEERRQEFAARFAVGSDGWAELSADAAAWATDHLVGWPGDAHGLTTQRRLTVVEVQDLVRVDGATIAAAEPTDRDWTRLWVDLDIVIRAEANVCRQEYCECIWAGEVVRLVGNASAEDLSIIWEGEARVRIALEARVIDARRVAVAATPGFATRLGEFDPAEVA